MAKYKILIIVRWPVGGIRTFMRYVYRYFNPEKYQFSLIAPNLPELNILLEELKMLNIEYISMPENLSMRNFFIAVSKEILQQEFDLIHSHGFTSGICTAPVARVKRIPHLMTSHDVFNDSQFLGFSGQIKKNILSIFFLMIDKIHSVSQDAQENFITHIGIMKKFPNKLTVIPNGIETARFLNNEKRDFRKELNLSADTFLIGFLGRFMAQKGFKYLVESLEIMIRRQNLPKKPLILTFGEGGFIREEKQIINDKGLKDYIIFMPFEPNIAPVLKGLDVVAIPSLWEACPLQPMEAMISGVPVIGTDCIGLREVLKDTPAVITPAKDSLAFAEALLNEMENSSLSMTQVFVEKAVDRFDVIKSAELIKDLIMGLCIKKN